MNTRRILFSSVVTSGIGVGLGLVMLSLAPCPYASDLYRNLKRDYLILGGVIGLLFGAGQETVRQLKRQCDEEDAIANQQVQTLKPLTSLALTRQFNNGKITSRLR
ncbi:MAG: hypothetical protein KME27_28640 [Lyngbya sp. HA4199-MV5]|jgi:hypothetical protein|nr:hypothetical protein [Lyngbya sp. HA4199-MV5]